MTSIKKLFLNHVGQTSPEPLALNIVKAEGVMLYDKTGKDYIDLIAGVSVANLGHSNPIIKKAVKLQVDKYMHLMVYGEFIEEPQVKFAELLSQQLPKNLSSIFFVNSGTEAIEGAMKLAKRYNRRYEIISFHNAYHGSSQGSLSLISDPYYTNSFRPLLPGIKYITFNNIDDLNKISEKTSCVIVEPVQAEAGIISPQNNFLLKLREKCDKTGTLLIFDEIQTGFGRLGDLFAFQKYKVTPDILVMAKAIGAGMPLGAFCSSLEIMNSFTFNPVLGHITTFGGHPVSAAAALAGLKYLLNNPQIIDEVNSKTQLFLEKIEPSKLIKEIRYNGLLMAVDLNSSQILFKTLPYLYDAGIHTDWFLFDDHSFRISPPLTITNDEIIEASKRINYALKSANKNG